MRSGGSALDTSKARKEFAQQLARQINQNLGPVPAEFPEQFRNIPVQEGVDPDAPLEPIEATPAEQVRATSPEELEHIAQSNKASAKGARFAARAFMKGAAKARQFGQNRDSN